MLQQGQTLEQLEQRRPDVDQFVWETMRYSSVTLETPTYFLIEAKRFYTRTEEFLDKVTSWTYGSGYAAKLLTAEADHMESEVLPRLRANISASPPS